MKDFIAANAEIDVYLKKQPGFILRRICEGREGLVVDMLLWRSAEAGRRAATAIVTELASAAVHAAIDQSTVDWSIRPCRHRVDRTGA